MATRQRRVSTKIKRHLIDEAGGKCANPGCPNTRVELHHIKHWSVYKCHNADDMIAICPSCHDNAHFGPLMISDDTLRAWKAISRTDRVQRGVLYVEPGQKSRLLLGGIECQSDADHFNVFNLSSGAYLSLKLLDYEILLVSLCIKNNNGQEALRVLDNNIRLNSDPSLRLLSRPGRLVVHSDHLEEYVSKTALEQMRDFKPEFEKSGVLLDLEVVRPGIVKVNGCWSQNESSILITDEAISFCRPGLKMPISLVGEEGAVLHFNGTVGDALFEFGM